MTNVDRIVALLDEVAQTHHAVYRIADGVDDDWASWYADWLLRLSELPVLLASERVGRVQRLSSSPAVGFERRGEWLIHIPNCVR